MTLTQMNYIITISETGSLNKAAEALYISQPSLTNHWLDLHRSGRDSECKVWHRLSDLYFVRSWSYHTGVRWNLGDCDFQHSV